MNAQELDYDQTYDLIASVHLDSFRKTGRNPWMPQETVDAYHAATIEILNRCVRPGFRILDAGCGLGELFSRIEAGRYDLTGLDLSGAYLEEARLRVPEATFVQGRLEALPFPDEHFHVVLATDCLEHVLHLDDVMRELLRVLMSEGILIVRVPEESSLESYLAPNTYRYIHVRRFAIPDLMLMFDRCFDCEVLETSSVEAPDGTSTDIHAVVRKS